MSLREGFFNERLRGGFGPKSERGLAHGGVGVGGFVAQGQQRGDRITLGARYRLEAGGIRGAGSGLAKRAGADL